LWNFDEGPNTGGMGAVGPLGNEHQRKGFLDRIKEEIFRPTLRAMVKNGRKFSGLLYAGLMLTKGKAFLLEFNVRFGDPETQALLFGTRADIYPLLFAIAHNAPFDQEMWQKKLLDMETTVAIVMASEGYPLMQKKEAVPITLPKLASDRLKIFFASTTAEAGNLMAGSGRVMSVVARGGGVDEARALGYEAVREIAFLGMQYRQDIGALVTDLIYSG
jgi:phosphoribosylamine--glycine ligase